MLKHENGVTISAVKSVLEISGVSRYDDLIAERNKVPSEFIRLFPQPGERVHLPADPRLHPHSDYVARHRARFAGLAA